MFKIIKWARKFHSVVVIYSGAGDRRGAHGNNLFPLFSLVKAAGQATHQEVREHVYSRGKN